MSITLSYPVTSPTNAVTLPHQNLEYTDTFELPVQYGKSMNGTFYTYKKTDSKRTFAYSFTNVRQSILDDLETFMLASAGQRIRLVDQDDNNWSVLLLTNPLDIGYERYLNSTCKDAGGFTLQLTGYSIAATEGSLLLETGDSLLLETGDSLLLEA